MKENRNDNSHENKTLPTIGNTPQIEGYEILREPGEAEQGQVLAHLSNENHSALS